MVRPFLLRSGFALFLAIAGFLAARRRPGQHAACAPPPNSYSPPDSETESGATVGTLDVELPNLHTTHNFEEEEALAKIMPRAPATVEEDHFHNSAESSGEEEEFPRFLLPDINKHHQGKNETMTKTLPSAPFTNYFEHKDMIDMEEEISNLRNLVQSLQGRERYLEMRLLEFHGLKEQEISMRELQNRLKISSTETNLLSMKIESLKAENEKLRAKVSDYSSVTAELEMERKNNTILKHRMESVCEEAKKKITALHARISELREKEISDLKDVVQVEKQLKRTTELEDEVIKLQEEKSRLINEKFELMERLSTEHNLNPVIRSPDFVQNSQELRPPEELRHLREENDKLKKDMEQLQTDRCAEIEELVYLRWVNACLRYELRNYQLPPGRTIARDLSRCLSLNSEQKVKELIMEYSNSGFNLHRNSLTEINLDDCSSQESNEDYSETSHGCMKSKVRKPSKSKFINKLKKLVVGKNSYAGVPSSDSISSFSLEKASENSSSGLTFCDNDKWDDKGKGSPDNDFLRRLNLEGAHEKMRARSKSDLGEVYRRKSMISVYDENFSSSTFNSLLDDKEGGTPEKVKLMKFAKVFKNS